MLRLCAAPIVVLCLIVNSTDAQKKSAGQLDALVKLLGEVDDAAFQRDVLQGMHKALNGRRDVAMPKGWSNISAKLLKSNDAEVRRRALQLGVIFGDPNAMKALRKRALDSQRKPEERNAALLSLVQKRDKPTLGILVKLLDDQKMRGAAIRHLAAYNDPATPKRLLVLYPKLEDDERRDALITLASRPDYALRLLKEIEEKRIPTRDVSAFVVRQMSALGDRRVTARLKQVWGDVRPTSADRAKKIAVFKKRLTTKVLKKADRVNGRTIFRKTCATCHRLFDDGKRIGPELTGGQRHNLDYLLENLLDPNAVIGRDFRMTTIVTDAGRIITGIIKEETGKTVTVQTANEQIVIPKTDIDIRKRSKVSMMPENQIEKMKFREVRDLFGYLMGATQVPLRKEP